MPGELSEGLDDHFARGALGLGGGEPVVGDGTHRPDEGDGPGAGPGVVGGGRAQRGEQQARQLVGDLVDGAADGVVRERQVDERAVDDEAVDLGVRLDECEVGVDRRRDELARVAVRGARETHGRTDVADDAAVDAVGHSAVEAGLVVEVPVDDGLGGAGLGGDVVHAHARAVLADGTDRRIDQAGPPLLAVPFPACVAAVARCRPGGRGGGVHIVVHLTKVTGTACIDYCEFRLSWS